MDAHLESECLFCRIATGAIRGPNRIVEFPNSVAILHFNQTYRGRSILVAKPHCTDMLELDAPTFAALGEELRRLAQALRVTLEAERINCANFGNAMPHLHWQRDPAPCRGSSLGRQPVLHERAKLCRR